MTAEGRNPTGGEPMGFQDTETKRAKKISPHHNPVKVFSTSDDGTKKKRPTKIYFLVDEIVIDCSALSQEEFRIALHVLTLMWSAEDGTIADDDWLIARRLGMPETQWLEYREILARSGWLSEFDGRLYNSIGKREFDKAQNALAKAIESGHRGGKAKAASSV